MGKLKTLISTIILLSTVLINTGVAVQADSFEVFDKDTTWSTQQKVKLIDVILAPGSNGDYTFKVQNTGDTKKKCEVTIIDTNEYAIPLDFRMTKNDDYVLGSETDWLSSAKYDSGVYTMELNELDEYRVEWKWDYYTSDEDDKRDTSLGENEKLVTQTYFVKIKVFAESAGVDIIPEPEQSSQPEESSQPNESNQPEESSQPSKPERTVTPLLPLDTGDNTLGLVLAIVGVGVSALGIVLVLWGKKDK